MDPTNRALAIRALVAVAVAVVILTAAGFVAVSRCMHGDMQGPLTELRHHYGSAYVISHPGPDAWLAQRRDDRTMLRADDPERMLRCIRDDYLARLVTR